MPWVTKYSKKRGPKKRGRQKPRGGLTHLERAYSQITSREEVRRKAKEHNTQ